jgi:hypothetical protein
MAKPLIEEYPVFFKTYMDMIPENGDLLDQLENSLELFEQLLYEVAENKQEFRYDLGKWTIKEVVQHMIDVERVFVYRALRFSRNDKTVLKGFDENDYVSRYEINRRDFVVLLDEFCLLRRATILMFKDFGNEILDRRGEVEGASLSVRALGYICSGHVLHHLQVIRERYL